jgi:hypothetical protein
MSWLNTLPAQPALSVRFRQRFLLLGEVLGLVEPFLTRLQAQQGRLRVATSTPWDIDVEAPGGFTYRLRRDGLRVQFSHDNVARDRLRVEPNESVPFDELLETTLASANDLLKALAAREAMVDRFGLVATVPMKRAQAPPGVARFLRSLESLPGHEPIRASCQIFSRLGHGEGWDDRVHYDVQTSEEGDEIEILLDFQRYLEPAVMLKHPATTSALAEFIREAVAHFEQFGTGSEGHSESRADLQPPISPLDSRA